MILTATIWESWRDWSHYGKVDFAQPFRFVGLTIYYLGILVGAARDSTAAGTSPRPPFVYQNF